MLEMHPGSLFLGFSCSSNNVFVCPMKYVTPNSGGAGDSKVSTYDTSSTDEDDAVWDDAITQVQMKEVVFCG
jgi:hypothetical protein